MSVYDIPDEATCLALLQKHSTPEHIIQHSIRVWDVGKVLAEGLLVKSAALDLALVRASCLLHDIGKYPCIVEGNRYHDIKGEQILLGEGFPEVARVIVQHVVLRTDFQESLAEEHVVFYADKRVVHDRLVSVDERFEYLMDTYGKSQPAKERLLVMKDETLRLEQRIFLDLDFGPQDVGGLL